MCKLAINLIFLASLGAIPLTAWATPLVTPPLPPPQNSLPQPLPEGKPLPLEVPLPSSPPTPQTAPGQETIVVAKFSYQGNTVFSNEQLDSITKPYLNRPLTFADLVAVRTAITKLYVSQGFITSGAFLSVEANQSVARDKGVVTLQIVEGKIRQVRVTGNDRLNAYVQRRLDFATRGVVNERQVREALRLLQIDPLVGSISADLTATDTLGESLLNVVITSAPSTTIDAEISNQRTPIVGLIEQRITLTQANLLGLGDTLDLTYRHTEGSNDGDFSYTVPVTPRNATVRVRFSILPSRVVQKPFDELDIKTQSRLFELSLRQPLIRRASAERTEELAIGLVANQILSETRLLDTPFPLSRGADDQGRTRITALRFFQEYLNRSREQVLVARSQLSVGLNALNSTINADEPDSQFVVWRGQLDWLRRLGTRNYLVLRSRLQLSDRPLVSIEQFSIGGNNSVRGFSQDALLGDNGVNASLELHIPVLTSSHHQVQVFPFADVGYVWNRDQAGSSQTLAAIGLGVQWNWGNLSTQLTYGLPLTQTQNLADSQLQRFNFSVRYGISF